MAKMIPESVSQDIKSQAEKNIFRWFQEAPNTEGWVILHSMGIATHKRVMHGEIDFLVLAPGLGMFALEVKGGRVKRKLGKWYFINKYGKMDEKIRGPFDQAWEGIYSVRNSIESKIDTRHKYLKNMIFGIGVMFPDIEYSSVGVDEAPWQVFDINDGVGVANYVKRIANGATDNLRRLGYTITDEMYPDQEDIQYLEGLLRGDFDIEVPLRIKQKYAEDGLIELTHEQAMCIEQLSDNPRALIRGAAGTGKTMLAIEAVKQAIANKEKTAFFCFNRLLGDWLEDYFENDEKNEDLLFVGSFHRYMIKLLKEMGVSAGDEADKQNPRYYTEQLPSIVVEKLGDCIAKFDKIVVDEAQDLFSQEYLRVMDLILRGGISKGTWIMFGDFTMQSIYSKGMTENEYLEMLQDRSFFSIFRLNKNCRNTRKICLEIENIIGIPENPAFCDGIDTPAVDHILYDNIEDQKSKVEKLLQDLLDDGVPASDIVILSPRKRVNSVVNLLDGFGIDNYSIAAQGRVRFSSVQAFKGLESSAVILTDIESYEDEKLIYIGLTRARIILNIFETKKASAERTKLFVERRLNNGG